MGIFVPRPSMRKREARQLKSNLVRHFEIMNIIRTGGMDSGTCSRIAYDIIHTSKARKAIWRIK